ncbi:MAG: flagellar basal body P-ring formation protein FlgA [Alphaproteobacteria bacterium]|nr:flagellar basal body P-ring formation protein FlgA [Alphaproteobacteria bacterium]
MFSLRILFLGSALLLAVASAKAEDAKLALLSPPVALKDQALVEGDVVMLGDLFDNLDDARAKKPIAYAPKPGTRSTLDVNWLYAMAKSQGVNWRPASQYDRIVVERAGQTVGRETIENALLSALAPYGIAADSAIELANRSIALVIPVEVKPTVAVRALAYDERSRRFTATLETPAGVPNALMAKVSGRVVTQVGIPVLARSIAQNEPISADDLKFVQISADAVRADTLTEISQIVGKAPRRLLKVGQMVSKQDIQRPIMVPKNSTVTMIVRNSAMTLTAQGRANEDGSEGDVIHVTNAQSRNVVEATVISQGVVSVRPQGARQVN